MTEREPVDDLGGRLRRVHLIGHELIEFCHRVGVIVCSVTVGRSPAEWVVVYVEMGAVENNCGQGEMKL